MSLSDQYKLEQVGIRMVKEPPLYSTTPIETPEDAIRLLSGVLNQYDREMLCVVNLDHGMKPINLNVVSVGTLTASLAEPREILKSVVLSNASSVMLLHNHPSGNPEPSLDDERTTERMEELCNLMGTPLQDHIILGSNGRYYSFRESSIMSVDRAALNAIRVFGIGEPETAPGLGAIKEGDTAKYTANKDARKKAIDDITDKLEKGVSEMFDSARFREWLDTMPKFHRYSLNNTILISMQKPEATYVAGYNAWQSKFHRQVKKGEKGIKIIAPSPYKMKTQQDVLDPVTKKPMLDDKGNVRKETVEVERKAFRVATVFDISQTDGKDIMELTPQLTGNVKDYEIFRDALIKASPVPVAFENIHGDALGFYSNGEKRIAVQKGMSQTQTVKTLIHEITHSILHDKDKMAEGTMKDAPTREVEAESVAYTVCQHFGIETSDYSFNYIAAWSSGKDIKELKGSLETIRSTARDLIDIIDEKVAEITKEREVNKILDIDEHDRDEFDPPVIMQGNESVLANLAELKATPLNKEHSVVKKHDERAR